MTTMTLNGTWTASDGQQLSVKEENKSGQFSMAPVGSAWWSSAKGSWNQGKDIQAQGSAAPFLGTVTFTNNGGVSYNVNFCISSSGQEIIFANGVFCQKSA